MDARIELYRGQERKFFGVLPFMPVVQQSLERLLGRELTKAVIHVTLLSVPEDLPVNGIPVVENVIPDYGYTYVKVYEGGFLVYQHPHPLSDIITQTLQLLLRDQYPDEAEWGFRLDIHGIPLRPIARATPAVQGGVIVQPYSDGKQPGFGIKRLAEPEPTDRAFSEFVSDPGTGNLSARIKVLIPASLERELLLQRPLSNEVEEGGFLVGQPYRDQVQEGSYLVEITEAVPAKYTGASFLHFTFTGDSFVDIKQTLRENRPDDRVLGWYHTHLFPATPEFGLSSIDFRLHFGTFTIPWQLAGLINIEDQKRTLRFYVRQANEMVECPYWVIDERS